MSGAGRRAVRGTCLNVAFGFARALRIARHTNLADAAVVRLDHVGAENVARVAQAHFLAGSQAKVALVVLQTKVVAVNEQHLGERQLARAKLLVARVVGQRALAQRHVVVVGHHHTQRAEHGEATRRAHLQVLTQRALETLERNALQKGKTNKQTVSSSRLQATLDTSLCFT